MSLRPAIFISAVSSELRSARQLVANTLTFLGYDPEWQDIFGTEEGDLRAMLRRRIDACKGIVQLIGKCYGVEPLSIDQKFGRVSYTQYEALYAATKGKRVWYLFLDENFPSDQHQEEGEEKRELQSDYRARVKAAAQLYHPLNTTEGLEASVLKLRDDLTRLRRGIKLWTAVVAGLLVLVVAISVWLLQSQQHSNEQLLAVQERLEKLQQGVNSFAEVQNKVRQEQPGQKPEEIEERTYRELGKEFGLDPVTLREQLPRFAKELKNSPHVTTYERANAAYVAKDYNEAERLALAAADEAQQGNPPKNAEAIKAFELAAWSSEKRIEYADALKRLRDAEQLTDRNRDPLEWARVQFAIAWVLYDEGHYRDAEPILREVVKEREGAFGPEDRDTLAARHSLANALNYEGKYTEAETEYRAVLKLREKVLGPGHVDTLNTRSELANALDHEGKYAEAEAEYRAVLKLREEELGAEHPDTLKTRNGLVVVLDDQGRFAEAETEYRAVIKLSEKALGPEHPDTLKTRNNLAIDLEEQGKYAESETEYRAVIKLRDKVLGPEHPDTLATRHNLAILLGEEGKYAETETEYRAVLRLEEKALGAEHPLTLKTRSGLGKILAEQGKYSEAETEDRAVVKLKEIVFGPEHPVTLGTREYLAEALAGQGKYTEAETEYRAVVKLSEKVIGPEHPLTLVRRRGLTDALAGQGRYAEAETEYRATLKLQEKVLGLEHPDTLRSCFSLAVCLRSESQFQEATAFAQRAADDARKVLGPEHRDTKKYEQLLQELLAKSR